MTDLSDPTLVDDTLRLHAHKSKYHRLRVSVPRQKVNNFLSLLWDELTENIGPVGSQEGYGPTENPEVYVYSVNWSSAGLPFIARLEFFNHTAKGITDILISTIDRQSHVEHIEATKAIKRAILEARRKVDKLPDLPSYTRLAQIPVFIRYQLSGLYQFEEIAIYPSHPEESHGNREPWMGFLEFPVFSKSAQDAYSEAQDKARDITALLTVLTQNLFAVKPRSIELFDFPGKDERQSFLNKLNVGQFVPDYWLFHGEPKVKGGFIIPDTHGDIVEPGDVIIDGKIALPERSSQAFQIAFIIPALLQSARRFQEGMFFREEMTYPSGKRFLGELLVPYQIISFVASIEALLEDTLKNKEQICPHCGKPIILKEKQISKSFMEFVKTYSAENPVLEEKFRAMYKDRSDFVHTGNDLCEPSALKGSGPFFLMGKRSRDYLPKYYHNMADLTGWLIRRYIYDHISHLHIDKNQ